MDFDEEKYQTKSSSDYWADVVKGIEKFNETAEEDNEEESKSKIFVCRLCGFMYDLTNPPKYIQPLNHYIISNEPLKLKCPNCGKAVLYDTATKEEYEKYLEKKQKEKAKKE